MPTNETIRTIERLRTIRRNQFSLKHIPDDEFETILKASVRAANASNRQSYSIVVASRDIQRKMRWPGDKAVVFCVDFTRLAHLGEYVHQTHNFHHLQPFLTGIIDTALVVQTAVIIARSLGIDSLITNDAYIKDLDNIYRELQLPQKYCFPLVIVSFGYPKEEPAVKKGRLNGKGIIHRDMYTPLNETELADMIREYDDETAPLSLIISWKEQGFAHYIEWLFSKWFPVLETEENSEKIIKKLKEIEFL